MRTYLALFAVFFAGSALLTDVAHETAAMAKGGKCLTCHAATGGSVEPSALVAA